MYRQELLVEEIDQKLEVLEDSVDAFNANVLMILQREGLEPSISPQNQSLPLSEDEQEQFPCQVLPECLEAQD